MESTQEQVVGSGTMQIVPGYWELHIVDEMQAPRGKLKIIIRTYDGPPIGAPTTQAAVPIGPGAPGAMRSMAGAMPYPALSAPAPSPAVYHTGVPVSVSTVPPTMSYGGSFPPVLQHRPG
mmetsp:Transcript_91533/g.294143  ORF Transcript_91533/g.294143 Transcript_91533/m.294143 type:complete len:120 (-) Transcript_91533:116-475(-)